MKTHGRRTFLRILAGTGVAAAGGFAFRGWQQNVPVEHDPSPFESWRRWRAGPTSDGRGLILAASLAASPHNTQPWRFREHADAVDVYADLARNLGSFDPFRRELYLGLGCAIENMRAAAPRLGLELRVVPFPETTNSALAARVSFARASESARAPDVLGRRHTHRGAYSPDRVVSDAIQRRLLELREEGVEVRLFEAASVLGRGFVDATLHATDRITSDAKMTADSDRWYRHEWSQIASERDGVTLRTAGLPQWLSTLAAIAPRPAPRTGHEAWARSTREIHCATAPLFGVVAVRDRFDRHAMLRAGSVWQRLHLLGTELGLAMQPLNQIVELADRDRELGRTSDAEPRLRALAGDSGLEATFAFRCGHAAAAAKESARRPVERLLVVQRPR